MNKTLIAAAVSAALMAPVAAQADVTVYGRIHNGIAINDTDGSVGSSTDLNGAGGRFGFKASSDLGNGLTASAQYEFSTSTDKPGSGVGSTRVATVGLSGGFGSVNLGNQWGAYYNNAAYLDPTYTSPGILYYDHSGPLRTANTIAYSNSFGAVSIQLDSRVNDSDADNRDGFAAGATVAVNDMISVSGAIDDSRGVSLTALQGVVSFGDYWLALARHSVNPDGEGADPSLNQIWVGGSMGSTSAMLGLGRGDSDGGDVAGNDPSGVTLGVYHDMGGGLTLMYEGGTRDNDGAGGDTTDHWLGMMLNF